MMSSVGKAASVGTSSAALEAGPALLRRVCCDPADACAFEAAPAVDPEALEALVRKTFLNILGLSDGWEGKL